MSHVTFIFKSLKFSKLQCMFSAKCWLPSSLLASWLLIGSCPPLYSPSWPRRKMLPPPHRACRALFTVCRRFAPNENVASFFGLLLLLCAFALSASLRSVTPVVLVNGMAKALGEGGTRGPVPDPPPLLGSGRDHTPPIAGFPRGL